MTDGVGKVTLRSLRLGIPRHRIYSRNGMVYHGEWAGLTPVESLASFHESRGYQCTAGITDVHFLSQADRYAAGGIKDWIIEPVDPDDAPVRSSKNNKLDRVVDLLRDSQQKLSMASKLLRALGDTMRALDKIAANTGSRHDCECQNCIHTQRQIMDLSDYLKSVAIEDVSPIAGGRREP